MLGFRGTEAVLEPNYWGKVYRVAPAGSSRRNAARFQGSVPPSGGLPEAPAAGAEAFASGELASLP
jgi:hypothetical protein